MITIFSLTFSLSIDLSVTVGLAISFDFANTAILSALSKTTD